MTPDPKWHPYRIEVIVSGVFGSKDASPELFDQFCRSAAPSILFPYIRQIVHSVTADAIEGQLRLDPVNVQALVASALEQKDPTPGEQTDGRPASG